MCALVWLQSNPQKLPGTVSTTEPPFPGPAYSPGEWWNFAVNGLSIPFLTLTAALFPPSSPFPSSNHPLHPLFSAKGVPPPERCGSACRVSIGARGTPKLGRMAFLLDSYSFSVRHCA